MSEVSRYYGISRKTFYKWYHRYQDAGRHFHALKDRSRRPHSHPRAIRKPVVERIVAMRRKTNYGPRRLAYYLAQEGIHISVYGVYRIDASDGSVLDHIDIPDPEVHGLTQHDGLIWFCCARTRRVCTVPMPL